MAHLTTWLLPAILIILTLASISFADDHKMRQHNIHDWFPNWWFPEMKPPVTIDDPLWDRTAAGWQSRNRPKNGWAGLLIENDDQYNKECGTLWHNALDKTCFTLLDWTCTRVGVNRTTAAMTFIANKIMPDQPYGNKKHDGGAGAPLIGNGKRDFRPCSVMFIKDAIRIASGQKIELDMRDRSEFCNDHGCVFWKCQAAGVCPR